MMYYDELTITREELIELLNEDVDNSECSDMTKAEIETIKTIAKGDYYGFDEDIDYILEKIEDWPKEVINWQTITDIVSEGDWYFQED